MRPLLLATCLALLTAAAPARAATDAQRAAEVMRSVQQRFWDGRRHVYVGQAGHRDAALMWDCGIAFSALDAAARADPATYRPVLSTFFTTLDRYWDRDQKLGGYEPAPTAGNGDDKYYDDNEWMAITFAEAYAMTGNPAVLRRMRETTDFVLSGGTTSLGAASGGTRSTRTGARTPAPTAPGPSPASAWPSASRRPTPPPTGRPPAASSTGRGPTCRTPTAGSATTSSSPPAR